MWYGIAKTATMSSKGFAIDESHVCDVIVNECVCARCRHVLALEHSVIEYVEALEPVFQWCEKSRDPEQFLLLTDTILDLADLTPVAGLISDHAERVERARMLRQQIRSGMGRCHLMQRSIPWQLSRGQTTSIAVLERMVRTTVFCLLPRKLPVQLTAPVAICRCINSCLKGKNMLALVKVNLARQ